jgi:hypothetical protein
MSRNVLNFVDLIDCSLRFEVLIVEITVHAARTRQRLFTRKSYESYKLAAHTSNFADTYIIVPLAYLHPRSSCDTLIGTNIQDVECVNPYFWSSPVCVSS